MVFCNVIYKQEKSVKEDSHNPYFNRWFSAISGAKQASNRLQGHNPYFNRWFSAICILLEKISLDFCHNPYFNRWFSAIDGNLADFNLKNKSQSLF